jgi:hypothetical protein
MTVDIYIYAEQRRNGVWTLCSTPTPCHDSGEDTFGIRPIYQVHHTEGDYPLARVLLDASCAKPDGSNSRLVPRGWPDGLSPELRNLIDCREQLEWMCNYPSWLLLQELLEITWDPRTQGTKETTGYVDAEQYAVFRQTGRPERFASTVPVEAGRPSYRAGWLKSIRSTFVHRHQSVTRPKEITHAEMQQLLADGNLSTGAITQITYQTPHACQVFLQETLPLLKTFGEPDEVRIVFWF